MSLHTFVQTVQTNIIEMVIFELCICVDTKKQLSPDLVETLRNDAVEMLRNESSETKDIFEASLTRGIRSSDRACDVCAAKARPDGQALLHCARCHSVFYCSSTCQRKGWSDGHKKRCKALAAAREKIRTISTRSASGRGTGRGAGVRGSLDQKRLWSRAKAAAPCAVREPRAREARGEGPEACASRAAPSRSRRARCRSGGGWGARP